MTEYTEPSTAERWAAIAGHRDRLVRLARRRVPAAVDAEDCVHEAMLRVAAMPHVDPDRLPALLTSVTVRLCVDWQRRARAGTRAVAAYNGRRSVEADPFEQIADRAEARWLSAQLGRLGESERAVLQGRAEGRTPADLADQLGLSHHAVESAFARARRKLRLALAGTYCALAAAVARCGWRSRTAAVAAVPVAVAVTAAILVGITDTPAPNPSVRAERPRILVADQQRQQIPAEPPVAKRALRPVALGVDTTILRIGDEKKGVVVSGGAVDDPVGYAGSCLEDGAQFEARLTVDPGGSRWVGYGFYQGCGSSVGGPDRQDSSDRCAVITAGARLQPTGALAEQPDCLTLTVWGDTGALGGTA